MDRSDIHNGGDEPAHRYGRLWGLSALSLAGETASSWFYSCVSERSAAGLLKLCKPDRPSHEAGGFDYLARITTGDAVFVHRFDAQAALMEVLDGPRLLDLLDEGPVQAEEAVQAQIDVTCRLLDAAPDDTSRLTPLDKVLEAGLSLTRETTPAWARDVIPEAQAITGALLKDRGTWGALHGDLHPRNILCHGGRWRVIDAHGWVGPASFDFANLFINPWDRKALIFEPGRMERIAELVAARLQTGRDEVIAAAIANALFHAEICFREGAGRHPTACLRHLLGLLSPAITARGSAPLD